MPEWDSLQWLEALSYIITVVTLPFALWVFIIEQRKERLNDDEEMYLQLADNYDKFLKLVLENADLSLISNVQPMTPLTPEQEERKSVLFEILVGMFERAYILVYEEEMTHQNQRLWKTWEDYMRDWCVRPDFRERLPRLLEGEDPDFSQYIRRLAEEQARKPKELGK